MYLFKFENSKIHSEYGRFIRLRVDERYNRENIFAFSNLNI